MRDLCGTLKNHWYVAAQSTRVTRRKPISSVILDTRLVLFRPSTGPVAALRDRCTHRHQLLSHGTVRGNDIQCPYHGWTFSPQGDCVNVPSEGPCGKAFGGREVEAFPVREKDGLIWVWMGGSGHPADHEPLDLPPAKAPGWGSFCLETEFPSTVDNCVESFMDVPHTVWVHTGWFRRRRGIKMTATVERNAQGVLVTYDAQDDSLGWGDRLFNPQGLPLKHTDRFCMPSTTRVDYAWGEGERGLILVSTSVPISPTLTKTYTFVTYRCGGLNWLFRWVFPWYRRTVIDQDLVTLRQQGESLSEAPAAFKHTPADTPQLLIAAMREWAQGSGEQGEAPRPLTTVIEFWI
jgi:phenylpropionate dioxygenase-like ring-hydroxylating dioxygenase large terminal subunit